MITYLLGFFFSIFSAPEFVVFILQETIALSLFSAFSMALVISLGGTLGSTAIYCAARMVGKQRVLELTRKQGKKILLKTSDMEKIEYWYSRWGGLIVFFGRWLPTFRSLISIPAGLSGMQALRFILLTFTGTLIWNTLLCSILFSFRAYLEYLEIGLEGYTKFTLVALVLLITYFVVQRISERISKKRNVLENGQDQSKNP